MDTETLDRLRNAVRGPVIGPEDARYDEARKVYNGMLDKRPAAVVPCRDVADVRDVLAFARGEGVDLAVRGGGHSAPGLGVVDGGVTLDLAPMRWVRVDPRARTVQAGGGSLLGDLDHATHAFGMAVPTGINSTTGIGGLTLGGGHGYLTRKYGLTLDSLIAADVVLADGTFVTASERENAELFWALRGGGGNFGVVTAYTYRLHPVDTVGVGVTVWPVERTPEVLAWYREFLPQAEEDVYGFFAVLAVPPGPPFPEELHGRKMCGVVWCWTGDPARTSRVLEVVREPGRPAFHFTTPMPYPQLQRMFDELLPAGLQWYWRGDFFDRIPDEALEIHRRFGEDLPSGLSTMHLYPVDRAVHQVGKDMTAWGYRDALWSAVYAGIDPDPANAKSLREWCVGYWEALHPYSMGGSYVNFLGEGEGEDRVRATYRENYDRLARVKRAYDPDNFFHVNQNVRPAART
ncbi:oxidoreductase [Streptomyces sp. Ru73]|uniref:FAD-binding oxidoreductase n=1 Tax=Streptomyces sp. Ru73 TaxID=2080748 RepID=UPI000CDE50DE|nr:FAD-binding oxidoreductase [Streptomyces sp. Ru73]POX39550.1 oxidoreductase [Streptomyces sp. Ru73]